MIRSLVLLGLLFFCPLFCSAHEVSVTSDFGWRVHPVYGYEKFHTGVDLGYSYGSPVGSLDAGTVVLAGWNGGYGNCVVVEHDNGDCTLYGHLARVVAEEGERVEAGRLIGYSGSTGVSTGPHLHVEWWHNGQYCDPLPLFANGGRLDGVEAVGSGMAVAGKQLIPVVEEKGPDWHVSSVGFSLDGNPVKEKTVDRKVNRSVRKIKEKPMPVAYTDDQVRQIRMADELEKAGRVRKDTISYDGAKGIGFNM